MIQLGRKNIVAYAKLSKPVPDWIQKQLKATRMKKCNSEQILLKNFFADNVNHLYRTINIILTDLQENELMNIEFYIWVTNFNFQVKRLIKIQSSRHFVSFQPTKCCFVSIYLYQTFRIDYFLIWVL